SRCYVLESGDPISNMFVPPVSCAEDLETNSPIPDYSPPWWMIQQADTNKDARPPCVYPGPATWVSVIGANRFWPMASLTDDSDVAAPSNVQCPPVRNDPKGQVEPGARPEMPPSMQLLLLLLLAFSFFHLWCCASGSYTAKPAFRSHFAGTGDPRQRLLVFG